MKNKKKAIKTKKKRNLAVIVVASILTLCLFGAVWAISIIRPTFGGSDVRLYVPRQSTAQAVADTLTSRLGEEFGSKVYRVWKWKADEKTIPEGSFVIKSGMSVLEAARKLTSGAQDPINVTFNNIRTLPQLASRMGAKLELTPEEFVEACDSVLGARGMAKEKYPAFFIPDTYQFYWNVQPQKAVEKLVAERDKFWTDERIAKAKSLGLTPEQVATVASIVEEETVKADERPKVARLYLNRLAKGMKLQADPTVKYAVGDFSLRRITGTHLAVQSPYNTYLNSGLPPGPIRVVERTAIDAVLDAPVHDYIYMCAKEDFSGYHNFAKTDKEHMENARRYHRALNSRGIR